MLVQFTLKNYKSFKEEATLSMVASNYDKDTREEENIFKDGKFKLRLLKSAVVYGANASGKSNLLDAFAFFRSFLLSSSKDSQREEKIAVSPFLLNTESEKAPCEFEVVFIHNEVQYRYGFEASENKIHTEWLFQKLKVKEVALFYREEEGVTFHQRLFAKGKRVFNEGLLRNNALLLSVAAQFNDDIAGNILEWFKSVHVISGLHGFEHKSLSLNMLEHKADKAKIINLLKAADLGVQDLQLQRRNIGEFAKALPDAVKAALLIEMNRDGNAQVAEVLASHRKYNELGEPVGEHYLDMDKEESSGTQKLFEISGTIINVLENGSTLIIDELDAKLHPNLVEHIIKLFNSNSVNKHNAQLVFNTHNTNLLSGNLFRRDQVWFTEKDRYGRSQLYSLADFKSSQVKKQDPFESNYVKGKYGGIPYLEGFAHGLLD